MHPAADGVGSLAQFLFAAEPENLRPGALCHPHAGRIVGVQHSEVFGLLVLEDAGFGIHVDSKGAMAVQMVRRDV